MQKSLPKKKPAADSRKLIAKISEFLVSQGAACHLDIDAPKCSHLSIEFQNGDRFRLLVEARS